MADECKHGQLARSCNYCEWDRDEAAFEARIAELEAENKVLEIKTTDYKQSMEYWEKEYFDSCSEYSSRIAELEAELLKARELVSNNLYDGSERIAELEAENHRLQTEAIEEWETRVGKPLITELEAENTRLKTLADNYYAIATDRAVERDKLREAAKAGLGSCKTKVTLGDLSYYTYPSEELCDLAALLEEK